MSINKQLKKMVFRISPKNMLIIMAAVIFIVETLVMFILSGIPPVSRAWEALLDSTILLLLLSPFYLYIYRPFWEEHQNQARQIRFLSQRLLTAKEEESKRVACNIHDQCGQTLTALQFGIQVLRKQSGKDASSLLPRIDELEQMLSQLSEEFRNVTSQLRPAILDQAGLVAALTSLINNFQENYSGIKLDIKLFRNNVHENRFAPEIENTIYRICQEGLTNIARHAKASEVLLNLSYDKNVIELRVQDNGVGFDVDGCLDQIYGPCGVGLLGMRERALMVNGRLQIESDLEIGTSIKVSIPISEEQIS